ncbi:hypothetical protein IC582_017137 [Cucumis melo]|uniref:DUF1218 domain-containing protein n=2 Tax=Cucumis melo TaxID=3656 RepID=A0A5D3D069_CUCMM|nr:uncharacterized protein LOC103494435 [Cucumis melo]KAA0044699.1 DUF1218 domain-containing protein [Cucumis melo var. makuwa]TYK16888.1 DUF1218 domain-containing protein [Cucumis melo var. makuwa]
MERKAALVVKFVVAFLGIVMIATGFAAEATRTKGKQVTRVAPDVCKYPRSPAMGLGFTAALSLLFAQITIKASTGCVCCIRGPRPPKWRTAVICFTVSWITYVIAFLLFLTGAALNNGRDQQRNYLGNYECYVLKPGVFSFATIVGVASLTLGMSYFLILNSAKNDPSTVWGHPSVPPQPNIAMAQPQFPNPPPPPPPQRTTDPVFVHEDTYMRRQFT